MPAVINHRQLPSVSRASADRSSCRSNATSVDRILLLARWLLDHNGVDGGRSSRWNDEALGSLLVSRSDGAAHAVSSKLAS